MYRQLALQGKIICQTRSATQQRYTLGFIQPKIQKARKSRILWVKKKARTKASVKTQRCVVRLKKELEWGSTTLVDLGTTEKNKRHHLRIYRGEDDDGHEESDEAEEKITVRQTNRSIQGDPIKKHPPKAIRLEKGGRPTCRPLVEC
jgi:hypothetical protein